jgi:hypothetical protein
MNRSAHFLLFAWLCLGLATVSSLAAQQSNQDASASIPHLIRFSGVLKDGEGKPAKGTVGVTFAFYKEQQGGTPLWMESQDVTPDATGRYSVMLGATKSDGLPEQLFISKEARWLSVEAQSLPAPARVLLLSVPYALKAADAETIGGLPPSAFALAAPPITSATPAPAASTSNVLPASSSVTTSGGTGNFIALFSSATDIENSAVSQTGSGSTAKIGINTTAPASTLDVKGTATVRGTFSLPATGVATATGGKSSQPANLAASVFNSSSSAAVAQTFQFKAEPTGNNTTAPSGTLNFLYGAGTSAPAETGLKIKSNGQITFAAGQTFPGTGNGTITGVTAGTDLTGGGVGGVPTLNLDTTKVPQLNSANTFTANQAVTGNLSATGAVTGSTVSATSRFNLGGSLFAFGSTVTSNVYLGFAGTSSGNPGTNNTGVGNSALLINTGSQNTAVGTAALASNTSGSRNTGVGYFAVNGNGTTDNTAIGFNALSGNFTGIDNYAGGSQALDGNFQGSFNTGVGMLTLHSNGNGNYNSALGYKAGTDIASSDLTNTTAIGALADVTQSNSMVLGAINGVNGSTVDTNVGIGTTAPAFKLHVGLGNNGFRVEGPPQFTLNNPVMASFGGAGDFSIDAPGIYGGRFIVKDGGLTNVIRVGIGTAFPDSVLSVNGSADKPGGGSWGTYSDARLKNINGDYNAGLSQILKLHPVRYEYKKENALGIHDSDEHVGFVAQDVQKVIPEAVTENNKGYLMVNNDPILWTMLNAIKEQQRQISTLRAQLRRQAAKNAVMESRLAQIEHVRFDGKTRETSADVIGITVKENHSERRIGAGSRRPELR